MSSHFLSFSLSHSLPLSPFLQAHRCPESNADGYYSSTLIWAQETHCSLYVSLIIMIHRQSVLSAVQALQKCSLLLWNRQRCRERTEWGFFTVWQWLHRAWLSLPSPHLPLLHFISTSPTLPSLSLYFGNLTVCKSKFSIVPLIQPVLIHFFFTISSDVVGFNLASYE